MATYMTLASLTDRGVRTIKDLSRRLQNAEQTLRSLGAEFRGYIASWGTTTT